MNASASRLVVAVCLAPLTLWCPRVALATPPVQVLLGPVDAVAASEDAVVAATGHMVRILDSQGYPARSLWPPGHLAARRHRAPRGDGLSSVPGLTADSDWSDPIDPDVLDDPDDPRLADETEIRSWDLEDAEARGTSIPSSIPSWGPPPNLPRSETLAAAGGTAWVARADGLWRVDLRDEIATRVLSTVGATIDAVASASGPKENIVALISGGRLLRSRNGGETFEAVAFAESSTRALAITRSGAVFLFGSDGLHVWALDRSGVEAPPLARVTDLASCGSEVIVLADGDLYMIRDGVETLRTEHIGAAPPGVEKIVCGVGRSPWIAYGAGLWSSDDRGRTWRERTDLPPSTVNAVAISTVAIWIATSSGLWRLPVPMTGTPVSAPRPVSSVSTSGAGPIPSPRHWRWWAGALPRIDLSFTAARTIARRDYRGLVVLTFSLDRPTSAPTRGSAGTADPGRGRLLDEGAPIALPPPSVAVDADPVTADERRALAQALEDQP